MENELKNVDFDYCLTYINKAIEYANSDIEYDPKPNIHGRSFKFQNPSLEDVEKVPLILNMFQVGTEPEKINLYLINNTIKESYPDLHRKLTITDEQGVSRPCTPHDFAQFENQTNVILLRNLYFSKCFFFTLKSKKLSIIL